MNLMEMLAYAMLLSPAVVVLMDVLTERRKEAVAVLHAAAVTAAGVWMALRVSQESIMIPMVIAGTLGMVYAVNRLRGVAKFCTALPSAAFLLLAVAEAMPGIGVWARYRDYFYLLFNIATFIAPFVLLWHVWRQLPLCYDGLRDGAWRNEGVPLVARYRLLGGIAILALLATVWLTAQFTQIRETIAFQANSSLLAVHTELKELDHTMTRVRAGDRHEGDQYYVHMYLREWQSEMRRLSAIRISVGLSDVEAAHALTETIPNGVRSLFYEERYEDALAVVHAVLRAIETDFRLGGLSGDAYQGAVDRIMQAINQAGLSDYFN